MKHRFQSYIPGDSVAAAWMGRALLVAAVGLSLAPLGMAQAVRAPRETYRDAYLEWRNLDPSIETDAGEARGSLAPRAQPMAAAVGKYTSERATYLDSEAQETDAVGRLVVSLGVDAPSPLADPGRMQNLLDSMSSTLTRLVNSYTGTNDAALVRLRGALEEERTALNSVGQALAARRIRSEGVAQAQSAIDNAAGQVLMALQQSARARRQAAEALRQEAPAWASYYELLGSAVGAAVPTTSTAGDRSDSPVASVNAPLRTTITPVPLSRYTGRWDFPMDGLFHGPQPIAILLEVSEADGMVKGSFTGQFQVPPGSAQDSVRSFTFAGPLRAERNQVFPLTTPEGAMGTIELIPGPAFNLLEVNFQTDPVEGKIGTGNFILLKN